MTDKQEDNFSQAMINEIAKELLLEQRRSRRWGIFFKSLLAIYIVILLVVYMVQDNVMISVGSHTALIDIDGVISAGGDVQADVVVGSLQDAYADKNTKGIILRINSPGGSPVQSGYINNEIHRLKKEHQDIPVYAVITDICASGGYYIASAADEIYADKASIVGSIGVIMSSFGFVDAINKLGIERRLLQAGDNKGFLDPFSPLSDKHIAHVQNILDQIHQQFITVVKQGRGDRLVDEAQIFSGLIWSGEESLELGLIDGLGSSGYVAREVIGEENIVNYTRKENYLDKFAKQIGSSMANTLRQNFSLK